MKELSLEKMQSLNGGWGFDWKNCVAGMAGMYVSGLVHVGAGLFGPLGAVGVLAIGCGAAGFYS
jgi:hypothetical protein